MTHAIPWVKAIAGALVLAGLAPSAAEMKAPAPGGFATAPAAVSTPAQSTVTTQAGTCTVTIDTNTPAVEHLPKSQLAWEFDHEPDGTAAIKGPNGTIWRGNLQVGMGPVNPQSVAPNTPGYNIIIPNENGQPKYFQIVPPSMNPAPKMPNLAPILPPGAQKPPTPLPKPTP